MKNPLLSDILEPVREKHQKVVVCSHLNPDGDAIGAQIALTRCLNAFGIEAFALWQPEAPEMLSDFLKDTPTVGHGEELSSYIGAAVDCSDVLRVAEHTRNQVGQFFLNIDHHLANTLFGVFNITNYQAAATCELLASTLYAENLPFDKIAAEALLMGIMTDTGNFTYNNTSAETFFLTGKLVKDYEISLSEVAAQIYNQNSFQRVEFLSFFLSRIRLELDNQLAIVVLEEKDFLKYGVKRSDTEGFISHLLSLKGVKIAVFLDQQVEFIKGSLRSISADFNVHQLATMWGGGGHACAAGFKIYGKSINVFYREVLEEIKKFIGSC